MYVPRILGIVRQATIYMFCSLLLAVAVGLASLYLKDQRLLSVQSASMTPIFHPGDAIVVERVSASQLHVGDIISYRTSNDGEVVISHRLQSIDRRTGLLTTVGDKLGSTPDPPFQPSQVIGRATAVAPRLGLAMDAIRKPLGLLLLLYLPTSIVIISEIRRLIRFYYQPSYRHIAHAAKP